MKRLKIACEKSKRLLSISAEIPVCVDNFYDDETLYVVITRAKFEDLCKDLFNKLTAPIDEVINVAQTSISNIKEVVMVGGSTRIPKIKEIIDSGILGKIVLINHDEDVAYWHYCHSYVRGNWRREEETSPLLLAKCCHDMDLMYWYAGSKCKSVSSYGNLSYFTKENAPEGATERCFDCPHKDTCNFEATYQYVGRKKKLFGWEKKMPHMSWII